MEDKKRQKDDEKRKEKLDDEEHERKMLLERELLNQRMHQELIKDGIRDPNSAY